MDLASGEARTGLAPMNPSMAPERPAGLSLIAAVQAAHAVAVALSWHVPVDPLLGPRYGDLYDPIGRAVAIAGGLAIAFGLWRLLRWAWVAAMLWVGANMAATLYTFFTGEARFPLMLLSVAVVWYLNQSDVQRAFRAGGFTENGGT